MQDRHVPLDNLAVDVPPSPILFPCPRLPIGRIAGDSGECRMLGSLQLMDQAIARNGRCTWASSTKAYDAAQGVLGNLSVQIRGACKLDLIRRERLAFEQECHSG